MGKEGEAQLSAGVGASEYTITVTSTTAFFATARPPRYFQSASPVPSTTEVVRSADDVTHFCAAVIKARIFGTIS